MAIEAIIFDFDGVVADSEYIAAKVVAELATELGYRLSRDEALDLFVGKRALEVCEMLRREITKDLPDLEDVMLSRTLSAFAKDLSPVKGVTAFLKRHRSIPRCIASSSSHKRLEVSLCKLGLEEAFSGHVYSADDVARGKPFPDLFLHAAQQLVVLPENVLVIEDSPAGVKAAKAAGMRVAGLLAGAHVRPGLSEHLAAAGADFLASEFEDLERYLDSL